MKAALPDARALAVLFHRWVGLALAAFLVVEALTGSLLAWDRPLDQAFWAALAPVLAPVNSPGPLAPAALGSLVRAAHPGAILSDVDRPAILAEHRRYARSPARLAILPGAEGRHPAVGDVEIAIDPYTAQELGRRQWGDPADGAKNLMPFIHRLHRSFALGPVGSALLGVVALVWTLDCFVGAWLTLPKGRPLLAKWKPSWSVQRKRLNLDLHRAGGLWLWALLFVFAWSSVGFELPAVQVPVMRLLATLVGTGAGADATAAGDPVSRWMADLHTARIGGPAVRLVVCALGLAVAGLASTGAVVWSRKRRGRLAAARAAAARRDAARPAQPSPLPMPVPPVPVAVVRRGRREHRPSPAASPVLARRRPPQNQGFADSLPPWPPIPPTPRTETSPRHSAS